MRLRWYLHRLMDRDFMKQDKGSAWIIPAALIGLILWVIFIDRMVNLIFTMMGGYQ